MDCNNYSYTGKGFASDDCETIAEYNACNGYIDFTLEQWSSDRTKKVYCIMGFMADFENSDICETIPADFSEGWETARHAYTKAARLYNSFVPEAEQIPTF